MESLFAVGIGFIRDSVVYRDFAYRIDRAKSKFWAHVEKDRCWWMLEIHTIEQDYEYPADEDDDDRWPPDEEPTIELALPYELLPKRWRDLGNSAIAFDFEQGDAFPVAPGMLSTAYIGEHYSCTNHQLAIGSIFGSIVPIRWKVVGKRYPEDPGELFFVDVELQFAGVRCQTNNESDATILDSISPWFERSEFKVGKRDGSRVWLDLDMDSTEE